MQIAQEVIEDLPDHQRIFTVRIKDGSLMVVDGQSLSLTNKTNMSNMFKWSGWKMYASVEINISSTDESDNNLYYVVQRLREHDFLYDSVKNSPYHNFIITGWHKPSFYALLHLSYWHARFAEEFRNKGARPLAFDQVIRGFGSQFTVSYVLIMLDIGIQEMVTPKTIDKLITRIFYFLRSEPFANNE